MPPTNRTAAGRPARDPGEAAGAEQGAAAGGAEPTGAVTETLDPSPDHFIVEHINIQSMKPKLPNLRHDTHYVHDFDVLSVSETWLTSGIPDRLLTIAGYTLVRGDRCPKKGLARGHGGVVFLISDKYSHEVISVQVTGIADSSSLKILWIAVHANKQTFLIASAYRVPQSTSRQVTADLDNLEDQLQHMITSYPNANIINRIFKLLHIEK